jgi:hypothetical protein
VLVLSPQFIDSSIYLSNPIANQLSLIAVNDPAESLNHNLNVDKPSAYFGINSQAREEEKAQNEYVPMLHHSQLNPYSFSSLKQ